MCDKQAAAGISFVLGYNKQPQFTIPGDHKFVLNQTQAMVRIDVKHGKDSSIPECALTALNLNEDIRPPRDSCCQSAADYCLVTECSPEPMTYCEAEARCLARGLQAASRSFHENVDTVDPTKLGTELDDLILFGSPEAEDEQQLQDHGRALKQCIVKLTEASGVLAARYISNGSTAAALETEKARMKSVRNFKNRLLILNTQLQALKLDTFSQPSRASGGTTSVAPSATGTQDLDLEDIPEHAKEEAKNRNNEEITSR
ncbi:hypothetical protein FHG87_018986 [Trinorchestia longiramus]|nr:hypothetical protein FHG87_018986 [Trinorchestia longiramus]